MKKRIFSIIALAAFVFAGCDSDDEKAPLPSDISSITIEPRVGGAMLRWVRPDDMNYLYVQTRYEKNGRIINQDSSIHTDSVLISGLLNKYEYTFELQTFNADLDGGTVLYSPTVRPIRRAVEYTYTLDDAQQVALTANMLDTYTQETTEGAKANLVDGNINTYWHTAWSSGVAALPHWIQITFDEPTKLGAFKYYFRQNNSDEGGRPNKWDLQVSDDGSEWTTVWTSASGLPTSPVTAEQTVNMGKNFESKYFRFRIMANPGNKTYTHLGEFKVFTMGEHSVDRELEAEENYR